MILERIPCVGAQMSVGQGLSQSCWGWDEELGVLSAGGVVEQGLVFFKAFQEDGEEE